MAISLEQAITILTAAGGVVALYLQYRQHERDALRQDYDRMRKERDEYRDRCEGLEKRVEELEAAIAPDPLGRHRRRTDTS